MRPAIFLDKDGTLVENVPFNVDCEQIRLTQHVGEALRRWHQQGYALVVVTNQPGVALGYFDRHAVRQVAFRLQALLCDEGVPLAGFYYCPHLPNGRVPQFAIDCQCCKPQPGLLLAAAQDLELDLARSWLVGDILHDVEAGHRAGCRSILIVNGGETEWDMTTSLRQPEAFAAHLLEAELAITEYSLSHNARTPQPCL
jgi:D-glycero-D-manno-heptose 1,7-bisphosphate phosphatase